MAKKNAVTGWANSDQLVAANNFLQCGDAVWFNVKNLKENKATISVAGAVSSASSKDIPIDGKGWQMFANPFPVRIAIADIAPTGLTPSTWKNKTKAGSAAADIQIYNGSGYAHYYYISDAYLTAADKLARQNATTGWANSDQLIAAENFLEPGYGFWLKNPNGETGAFTFSISGK